MTDSLRSPFSLGNKIIGIVTLMVLATTVAVGSLNFIRTYHMTRDLAGQRLAAETRLTSLQFQNGYQRMIDDGNTLANMPPVPGLIRAIRNGGIDPIENSSIVDWRRRLETIFRSFMETRPAYVQLRYIGLADQGRELVRVNRTRSGMEAVPENRFQRKQSEPYFQQGQQLEPGEVYISKVTFNREYGQVDPGRIPTIRVMVPVHDDQRQRFGMIVINVDYSVFLKRIMTQASPERNAYIINEENDWVDYQPDSGIARFQFHEAPDYLHPPVDHETFVTKFGYGGQLFQIRDHLAFGVRLPVDNQRTDLTNVVVLSAPEQEIMADADETWRATVLLSSIMVAIALGLSVVIARQVTRPLNQMTQRIRRSRYRPNRLDLPVQANDEIGELARAFMDLTARLSESRSMAQAVMNRSVDGIITVDDRGKILSYNEACEKMFGYEANQVMGQPVALLLPNLLIAPQSDDSQLPLGQQTQVETTALRRSNTEIPVELSISEVWLGDVRIHAAVIRDISDRRTAEAEREQLLTALAKRNQDLDDFAHIASHDLKAPLRVIRNASQWLVEDLDLPTDSEPRSHIELLQNRVRRMENLLDDLLEYSRIGRTFDDRFGELVTGDVIARDVLLLISPPQSFQIQFTDSFRELSVARMPLQQILLNLIHNAIKHHDRDHGQVTVSADRGEESLKIQIQDDGPGIAPEFRDKAFQIFQTLKPRDQVEGSGVGLAIVKKYCEQIGADVQLDSRPGEGCRFTLIWPLPATPRVPEWVS